MEFEIGDDPQGFPENLESDRDGGLREDRLFFRKEAPARKADRHDDAGDEDMAVKQLGEAA